MERKETDSSILHRISEAPFYAGNDPGRVIFGVEHSFQQALNLPLNERVNCLRGLLPLVSAVLSSKVDLDTRVSAHLTRLGISFELARCTKETPEHLDSTIQLKRFTRDSYEYLIQKSP